MSRLGRIVGTLAAVAWLGCGGAASRQQQAPAAPEPEAQEAVVPLPEVPSGPGDPAVEQALRERLGSPAVPAEAPDEARRSAREAYDGAFSAIVQNGDLAGGLALLERAVELDPEFGEAWYQLGTARSTHAFEQLALGREPAAVDAWRRAIEEQRRARTVLRAGGVRELDAFEWHEKLAELDATLEEADRWLAVPEELPERLRERAVEAGYLEDPEAGPPPGGAAPRPE
ncbi:MAG TPA: hypothetical protein VLA66_12690 [Thermoanaerobaculia bacterium]|nr:hypothetical protein [Thermoanaerobaculia bacterium]